MSAAADKPRAFDRGAMFRLCRMLHAYFSALAFLALLFFSVTGVLLNHPEWFANYEPAERETTVTLAPAELSRALASAQPGQAIAKAVASHARLHGAYASADRQGQTLLVRLEGPKGSSDLDVNLTTGLVRARIDTASNASILMDLHRGKNSGAAWRWVIDVTAGVVTTLSIIGFVLFFSLRFRLRNSLILTGVGLAILVAIAVWCVS